METKNAKISSTMLGIEDHGILTCMLFLDYGDSSQGFGGYALDKFVESKGTRVGGAFGMEFIRRILEVFEVSEWGKLPGTPCRVICDYAKVYKIGHFMKDKWFDPKELADEFKGEK